jgi:hypothetical protein
MSVLQTFLEGVWKLLWKGDGVIGQWPNEDYDMSLARDEEHGILVTVSNGSLTKRYRVKLEEIR